MPPPLAISTPWEPRARMASRSGNFQKKEKARFRINHIHKGMEEKEIFLAFSYSLPSLALCRQGKCALSSFPEIFKVEISLQLPDHLTS